MTPEDYIRIDKSGEITKEDMEKYPGIHFCSEWDYLLIDNSFPEFECCICPI